MSMRFKKAWYGGMDGGYAKVLTIAVWHDSYHWQVCMRRESKNNGQEQERSKNAREKKRMCREICPEAETHARFP